MDIQARQPLRLEIGPRRDAAEGGEAATRVAIAHQNDRPPAGPACLGKRAGSKRETAWG